MGATKPYALPRLSVRTLLTVKQAAAIGQGGFLTGINSTLHLTNDGPGANIAVLRGSPGQSANTLAVQDSAGETQFAVQASGLTVHNVGWIASRVRLSGAISTRGQGGGAGLLQVFVDGTEYGVPFFALV